MIEEALHKGDKQVSEEKEKIELSKSNNAQSGDWSSSSITGEECCIDISATSSASICANKFTWKVRLGAVIVQRWKESEECYPSKFLDSRAMELEDGREYKFEKGEIVESKEQV